MRSRIHARLSLVEPGRRFGRDPFDNAAERAARDMVFLRTFGVAPDILAAAATRAAKENVCPSRGLLAYEAVSESLFYRRLGGSSRARLRGRLAAARGTRPMCAAVSIRAERSSPSKADGSSRRPTRPCGFFSPRAVISRARSIRDAPWTTPAHLAAVVRHRAGAGDRPCREPVSSGFDAQSGRP